MSLYLYNFFHLNIAYSAIEEDYRAKVIKNCYWPLLRLAKEFKLPFGIEITGYTLEVIASIDQKWIDEFKYLIDNNICELIGSGYSQIIGPIVPYEVNKKNLVLGKKIYKKFLDVEPKIALINEQAFSSSIISAYLESNYEAIIMEWNNPYKINQNWSSNWQYFPQRAKGIRNKEIPVIWNNSINFQKFQRYAHGEIDLKEILTFIKSSCDDIDKTFCVYGNDVEIFDFRPGRYMCESRVHPDGEWNRIRVLYKELKKEYKFIKPSEVLNISGSEDANNLIKLTSASNPIAVKKQFKYNISRWAVTGRDDLRINTACWQIYSNFRNSKKPTQKDWAELCYLWSSDFRTHIAQKRWKKYLDRLNAFQDIWKPVQNKNFLNILDPKDKKINYLISDNTISIEGANLKLAFNIKKGLSLDYLIDKTISEKKLIGTLRHGALDNIDLSADFYSGHMTFDNYATHKTTDLKFIQPVINQAKNTLRVIADIPSEYGTIHKEWIIDDKNKKIHLNFKLDWDELIIGSLRLGYITLLPESYKQNKLHYITHNGGEDPEIHKLRENFNHGGVVSHLISSNQLLGLTDSIIRIGDDEKGVCIEVDKSQSSLVGMVHYESTPNSFLLRVVFSARENDDTTKPSRLWNRNFAFTISCY